MVILDIGEDTSNFWTPSGGVVSRPACVALSSDGRILDLGSDAGTWAFSKENGIRIASLFDPDTWHPQLASLYLSWLLRQGGITSLKRTRAFLTLPVDMAPDKSAVWCDAVTKLGGDPLVIDRPTAATLALDLQSAECRSHLVVEISERHIALAAVVEGCVVASRCVAKHDPERVNTAIAEILGSLDPDSELEIRDAGIHLYGPAVRRSLPMIRATINLRVATPLGSELTAIRGARIMAEQYLPWLV